MPRVNLNSAPDLRTECDNHLAGVLSKAGYTESFALVDAKLVIGYTCVALAGAMYWLEKKYKNDFNNDKYVMYTQILVVLFFSVEAVWWVFSKFIEKTTKYVGIKGSKTLRISTHLKSKEDPVYYLEFDLDGTVDEEQLPFATVFNTAGFLEFKTFSDKIKEIVTKLEKNE